MATPSLDQYYVKVALNAGPLSNLAAVSWTDITAKCCGTITIDRGRDSALAVTSPGRASFQVDNYWGDFDPLNPEATYRGLRTRCPVQIQVKETDSASSQVTHTLFTGYLDAWGTDYRRGYSQPVTLTATDALGAVFPRLHELESEWEYQLGPDGDYADMVVEWFPMGDKFTETAYNIATGGSNGVHILSRNNAGENDTNSDPTARAAPSLIYGQGGDSQATRVKWRKPDSTSATDQTVEGLSIASSAPSTTTYAYLMMVSIPRVEENSWVAGSALTQTLLYRRNNVNPTFPPLEIVRILGGATQADWGKVEWYINSNSGVTGGTWTITSTTKIDDGRPHLIHCNRAGGTLVLYIDGQEEGTRITTAGAVTWTGAEDRFTYSAQPLLPMDDAVLDDLVILDSHLSDEEHLWDIATIPLGKDIAVDNPTADPHKPGIRLSVILDRIGWPSGMRTLQDGDIEMQPAAWGGRQPLDLMRECEASEHGLLFMNRAGYVFFWARGWRSDATLNSGGDPVRTFTDAAGATSPTVHRFSGFTLNHSEENLRTQARVKWRGGEVVAGSKTGAYGPVEIPEQAVAASIETGTDATTIVAQILGEFDTPWPTATMSFDHDRAGDIYDAICSTELGDRVEVSWNPPQGPGRYRADWHVERINLTMGDGVATFEGELQLRLFEGTLFVVTDDNIAYDPFSRVNSATVGNAESGDTWVGATGWQIVDRQCEDISATTPILIDCGADDVQCQVTFPEADRRRVMQLRSNAGGSAGVTVGWTDGNSTTLEVGIIGGSVLGSASVQGYDNDVMRIDIDAATVDVFIDDIEVLSVTHASIAAETGQHFGVRSTASARALFDTFVAWPS